MKFRFITLLSLTISQVQAATFYSEAISGDLSGLITSPTSIGQLQPGENSIIGSINEGGSFNADVFTFSIIPGYTLTSLVFNINSSSENHFLAMSDETTLDADVDYLLFASLVTDAQNGNNLLATESDGGNQSGIGYSLPLSAGDYSLWFQETSENTVDYTFTLTAVAIPETSRTTILMAAVTFAIILLSKRNRLNDSRISFNEPPTV